MECYGLLLVLTVAFTANGLADVNQRNASHLRLMVIHPHYRPAEPYKYPGPSPPAPAPLRHPDPYTFMSAMQQRPSLQPYDSQPMPNWCKNIWEREECGMKCWMLRKICKNIVQESMASFPAEDPEGSHSMAQSQYNMMPYSPFIVKPAVAYSKAGLANTYYAQPSWTYAPIRRAPYHLHHRYSMPMTNDIGLNPHFTYIDGTEKLKTKPAPEVMKDNDKNATSISSSELAANLTKSSETLSKRTRTKGAHPVKVVQMRYPEAEVTTLSPLMFEYDQQGNKGYYGDRIYMSAVLPVSDRQLSRQIDSTHGSSHIFDQLFTSSEM